MLSLILKIGKALAVGFGKEFAPHAENLTIACGKLLVVCCEVELDSSLNKEDRKDLFDAAVHGLYGIVYEAEQDAGQSLPSMSEIISEAALVTFTGNS